MPTPVPIGGLYRPNPQQVCIPLVLVDGEYTCAMWTADTAADRSWRIQRRLPELLGRRLPAIEAVLLHDEIAHAAGSLFLDIEDMGRRYIALPLQREPERERTLCAATYCEQMTVWYLRYFRDEDRCRAKRYRPDLDLASTSGDAGQHDSPEP